MKYTKLVRLIYDLAFTGLILGSLYLTSPTTWAAKPEWHCSQGKMRWLEFLELRTEPTRICFQNRGTRFTSESCVKGHCLAWPGKRVDAFPIEFYSDKQSPASGICKIKGGRSRIVEVFYQENWIRSNYCYFEEDGSYVSAELLLEVEDS